jgi:hypothetical protein
MAESWQILFTDAAAVVGGHLCGVANAEGELLASRRLDHANTNLAEMEGVLLAVGYIETPEGMLLTDSLDAVKFLAGDSMKTPYTKRLDDYLMLRRRLKDAWPDGWVLAWIPKQQNRAHKALLGAVRAGC